MNYGMFEDAASDDYDVIEAQKKDQQLLEAAIFDAREQFGDFLSAAVDKADFKNRVALVKNDMMKVVANSLMPVPGVMRKVEGALKSDWKKASVGLDEFENMLRANWGASFNEFLNEFDEESQRDAREEFKNTFGVTDADINGFLPSIGASRKQADAIDYYKQWCEENGRDWQEPSNVDLYGEEKSLPGYVLHDISDQVMEGADEVPDYGMFASRKQARTEDEVRKVRDDLDKKLTDALDEGGRGDEVKELRQKLRDINDELSDSMRQSSRKTAGDYSGHSYDQLVDEYDTLRQQYADWEIDQSEYRDSLAEIEAEAERRGLTLASRKEAGEGDFPVAAGDKDYLLNKMQQKRYEIFPEFVAIPNPFQPPQRGIWSLIEDPVVNGPNRVFISYGHPGQDPNVSRRGWYAMVGDRVVTEGWPHIEDTFYEIKHVLERVDGYQSSVKQAVWIDGYGDDEGYELTAEGVWEDFKGWAQSRGETPNMGNIDAFLDEYEEADFIDEALDAQLMQKMDGKEQAAPWRGLGKKKQARSDEETAKQIMNLVHQEVWDDFFKVDRMNPGFGGTTVELTVQCDDGSKMNASFSISVGFASGNLSINNPNILWGSGFSSYSGSGPVSDQGAAQFIIKFLTMVKEKGQSVRLSKKKAAKCPKCDGMGRETYETESGYLSTQECTECGGTGEVYDVLGSVKEAGEEDDPFGGDEDPFYVDPAEREDWDDEDEVH